MTPETGGEQGDPIIRRPAAPRTRWVLIYDGACPSCRRWASRVRKWDRAGSIALVSAQDPDLGVRFPWVTAEQAERGMQLIAPDGATREGAAALEGLLRLLPMGRALSWWFAVPGARALSGRVYRWIARHRRRETCPACGAGGAR